MSPIIFDNSYSRMSGKFYARVESNAVSRPELIRVNSKLAHELGIDASPYFPKKAKKKRGLSRALRNRNQLYWTKYTKRREVLQGKFFYFWRVMIVIISIVLLGFL